MNIMKSLLPLSALMCFTMNAVAADVDKTLPWTEGGELRVDITSGQLEIRGWDKDEVKLTGDFEGDEDRLVFKNSGKNVKLELRDGGGSWWGGHSGGNVDFVVFTPINSNLEIEGTSLRVEINQIMGQVDVGSVSGSVSLRSESDDVHIETVSGDIEVEGSKGKVRLQSVSGDIDAEVDAYQFNAKTISGDVNGKSGRVEYSSLLSVSGDIDVSLLLAEDGRLEAQTVSGNIDIQFKDTPNADFEINTGPGGDIRNRVSKDRPDDNNHWGQELRFTVGDGDGNVELETMSGTVKLR